MGCMFPFLQVFCHEGEEDPHRAFEIAKQRMADQQAGGGFICKPRIRWETKAEPRKRKRDGDAAAADSEEDAAAADSEQDVAEDGEELEEDRGQADQEGVEEQALGQEQKEDKQAGKQDLASGRGRAGRLMYATWREGRRKHVTKLAAEEVQMQGVNHMQGVETQAPFQLHPCRLKLLKQWQEGIEKVKGKQQEQQQQTDQEQKPQGMGTRRSKRERKPKKWLGEDEGAVAGDEDAGDEDEKGLEDSCESLQCDNVASESGRGSRAAEGEEELEDDAMLLLLLSGAARGGCGKETMLAGRASRSTDSRSGEAASASLPAEHADAASKDGRRAASLQGEVEVGRRSGQNSKRPKLTGGSGNEVQDGVMDVGEGGGKERGRPSLRMLQERAGVGTGQLGNTGLSLAQMISQEKQRRQGFWWVGQCSAREIENDWEEEEGDGKEMDGAGVSRGLTYRGDVNEGAGATAPWQKGKTRDPAGPASCPVESNPPETSTALAAAASCVGSRPQQLARKMQAGPTGSAAGTKCTDSAAAVAPSSKLAASASRPAMPSVRCSRIRPADAQTDLACKADGADAAIGSGITSATTSRGSEAPAGSHSSAADSADTEDGGEEAAGETSSAAKGPAAPSGPSGSAGSQVAQADEASRQMAKIAMMGCLAGMASVLLPGTRQPFAGVPGARMVPSCAAPFQWPPLLPGSAQAQQQQQEVQQQQALDEKGQMRVARAKEGKQGGEQHNEQQQQILGAIPGAIPMLIPPMALPLPGLTPAAQQWWEHMQQQLLRKQRKQQRKQLRLQQQRPQQDPQGQQQQQQQHVLHHSHSSASGLSSPSCMAPEQLPGVPLPASSSSPHQQQGLVPSPAAALDWETQKTRVLQQNEKQQKQQQPQQQQPEKQQLEVVLSSQLQQEEEGSLAGTEAGQGMLPALVGRGEQDLDGSHDGRGLVKAARLKQASAAAVAPACSGDTPAVERDGNNSMKLRAAAAAGAGIQRQKQILVLSDDPPLWQYQQLGMHAMGLDQWQQIEQQEQQRKLGASSNSGAGSRCLWGLGCLAGSRAEAGAGPSSSYPSSSGVDPEHSSHSLAPARALLQQMTREGPTPALVEQLTQALGLKQPWKHANQQQQQHRQQHQQQLGVEGECGHGQEAVDDEMALQTAAAKSGRGSRGGDEPRENRLGPEASNISRVLGGQMVDAEQTHVAAMAKDAKMDEVAGKEPFKTGVLEKRLRSGSALAADQGSAGTMEGRGEAAELSQGNKRARPSGRRGRQNSSSRQESNRSSSAIKRT